MTDDALMWRGGAQLASVLCVDLRVGPAMACFQMSRWPRLRAIGGRVAIGSLISPGNGPSIDDRDDMMDEFTLASLKTHKQDRGLLHVAPLPCKRITTVSEEAQSVVFLTTVSRRF